ncbi:MAG: VWA domain-containing protein [Chromatiales bacterium]|nr:VWA domain-containing protein [Chromatiales bacterium]
MTPADVMTSGLPLGDITLLAPWWLLLLPVLAVLAWWWRRRSGSEAATGRITRYLHPLIALLPPRPPPRAHWRWLWRLSGLLGVACLVVALSEPVRVGERLPEPPAVRDIVLVVDTSVSMVLRDYVLDGERVSRMDVLKGLLDPFIAGLAQARVSVIVFAERSHTLVPLTTDTALARWQVRRLRTGMAGRFNALGEAIALGVRELDQASVAAPDGTDAPERRRFIVLFTDADQATGGIAPEAAAALAAEAGMRLYTVGIGATDTAAAEETLGGLLYAPVDRELLARLAETANGQRFLARDTASLREAIEAINRQEAHVLEVEPQRWTWPLYHWPLLAGLLLLSLARLGQVLTGRGA